MGKSGSKQYCKACERYRAKKNLAERATGNIFVKIVKRTAKKRSRDMMMESGHCRESN